MTVSFARPAIALVIALLFLAGLATAKVFPGIDVLVEQRGKTLVGKRVAVLTNQTGRTRSGERTIDAVARLPRVTIAAIFAPEHGLRGTTPAGAPVADDRDSATGARVYSLYGPNRKPGPAMLEGVDAIVYDLQDVGIRSYTYISTMGYAMEAAAERGIPFVVLDRPNPLGGVRVDGSVLDTAYRSFVGRYPIPYVYGMTAGELAGMIKGERWIPGADSLHLQVIPMKGWKRAMLYDETGLEWIRPSPNVPSPVTAAHLAALGAIGELGGAYMGTGTDSAFRIFAAPVFDAALMKRILDSAGLAGVLFTEWHGTPKAGKFRNFSSHGIAVSLDLKRAPDLFGLGCRLLLAGMNGNPPRALFANLEWGTIDMFDKVCGGPYVRNDLLSGKKVGEIIAGWSPDREAFIHSREKYLLYR